MNKRFSRLLLLSVLIGLFCTSCGLRTQTDAFYPLNQLLKDRAFSIAKVEDGSIVLYDEEQTVLETLPYAGEATFLYAEKDGAVIRFIQSGAVDDEQGVLFINDDANSALDGIHSVTRIGGNSYAYSSN